MITICSFDEFERKDFIAKYTDLFSKITDAPNAFQEAAAIFLISTMVQRNWIFKSLPDAPIFNGENTPKGKANIS